MVHNARILRLTYGAQNKNFRNYIWRTKKGFWKTHNGAQSKDFRKYTVYKAKIKENIYRVLGKDPKKLCLQNKDFR
jgi:hypothetical protein